MPSGCANDSLPPNASQPGSRSRAPRESICRRVLGYKIVDPFDFKHLRFFLSKNVPVDLPPFLFLPTGDIRENRGTGATLEFAIPSR
jgi:hypothetical protein